MSKRIGWLAVAAGLAFGPQAAAQSWPGGDESTRIDITAPDMGNNMSGAVWNPLTQKLWVVSNGGEFWRMSCPTACGQAASWAVDVAAGARAHWQVGGDTEAITQAGWNEDTVFVGIERDGSARLIREYDVSGPLGSAGLVDEWTLAEMALGSANEGLEALTFVPDEWLSQFVDGDGDPHTSSQFGTGGLFFAGLQATGDIFVFDLDRSGTGNYAFVGRYSTGESEIAGLEFDRSDGALFSYHNYGAAAGSGSPDAMHLLSITAEGPAGNMHLPSLFGWAGPRIHNNEGIAIAPVQACDTDGNRPFFLVTDDAGTSNSVGIYPSFPCTFELPVGAWDDFETNNYSGGAGWASDWDVAGDVALIGSAAPHSGAVHVRLRQSSGWMARTVDLSAATETRLQFWSKATSLESNDQAHVVARAAGGSPTILRTFVNGEDDNQYHFYDLDLSAFDGTPNVEIGFDAAMSSSFDYWYIDDVMVTYVVGGNRPPIAGFTASTNAGEAPLVVAFDATGSFDPDGTVTSFVWDFGDGESGSGPSPGHTFSAAGAFPVLLTVTDDGGATDDATLVVNVTEPVVDMPPTAAFIATPTAGEAPLSVDFDASASFDAEGQIAEFHWDYGDTTSGTGPAPSHTFTTQGAYTVTLTVIDGGGASDQATMVVTVTEPVVDLPPVAAFSASPIAGEAPLTVDFDASASHDPEGQIVSYAWDFGDGGSATGPAPSHVFAAGQHTVGLTVTDAGGQSDTATSVIDVAPPSGGEPSVLASDGFESSGWSGGTGAWTGGWQVSGDVARRWYWNAPHSGIGHARLRGSTGLLQRSVDLAGVTAVRLRFWSKLRSLEGSDQAVVRVGPAGQPLTTVMTFDAGDDDNQYHAYEVDLSGFAMTGDFVIAFDANMSSSADYWFVDDIEITGVVGE